MLFSSLTFLYVFLPILFAVYFLTKNANARKYVLIIFSLIFYAWGEPIYIFLMIFVVFINFHYGNKIGLAKDKENKKIYLTLCIVFDVLILIIFKYTNLIVESLNILPCFNINIPTIPLPLGISFYIFQAISYTVDVYRGNAKSQNNFSNLLLYIAFFPQLVAGPIVRYKDIMIDLENRNSNIDDIHSGVFRFSIGLAKKVLIANQLGRCVNLILDSSQFEQNCYSLWVAMAIFTLQIYFDFSGYSDMAIGLGRIFGFHFLENFNYPYISRSVTDFWRRWHISLSTFFRDYVYIPLGGKYKFPVRNIIIVWALTGIWHGASWNFLLWGLYYASLLIIEKYVFSKVIINTLTKNIIFQKVKNIFQILLMTIITVFGFTIFYFTDYTNLSLNVGKMLSFANFEIDNIYVNSVLSNNLLLFIVAIIAATPFVKNICIRIKNKIDLKVLIFAKTIIVIILIFVSTACLAGESYNPFLYFRF